MNKFHGVYPPIPTPFTEDDRINEAAYLKIIDYLVESGVHGLWVCGGSGEGVLLSDDERKRMVDLTVDRVDGRVKIIFHVGAPTTKAAVGAAEYAARSGVDALASFPPYFYATDDKSVVEHMKAVGAATDLPLFLYNLPSSTGVLITPALMDRLVAEVPTVAGIKHSYADIQMLRYFVDIEDGKLDVFVGDNRSFLPALTLGAAGCISSPLIPEVYVRLWERYQAGDLKGAQAAQRELTAFHEKFIHKYDWVGVMKFIISEHSGVDCGPPRLPNLALDPAERENVLQELNQLIGTLK